MRYKLKDEDRRREDKLECLGRRQPKCLYCPESDPFALHGVHPDIVCYECSAEQAGRAWIEDHHPAGRRNDSFTIPIPGNDHRLLNDMQNDWPERTLRNPDGSPLLAAAATVRGWLNILRLTIERTVGWVPPFLESLDAWLRAKQGDRWWEEFSWEGATL